MLSRRLDESEFPGVKPLREDRVDANRSRRYRPAFVVTSQRNRNPSLRVSPIGARYASIITPSRSERRLHGSRKLPATAGAEPSDDRRAVERECGTCEIGPERPRLSRRLRSESPSVGNSRDERPRFRRRNRRRSSANRKSSPDRSRFNPILRSKPTIIKTPFIILIIARDD